MTDLTSHVRQAAFRRRMAQQGYVNCTIMVPKHCIPELRLLAEKLRADPGLEIGPLRNRRTGRLVKLNVPSKASE